MYPAKDCKNSFLAYLLHLKCIIAWITPELYIGFSSGKIDINSSVLF